MIIQKVIDKKQLHQFIMFPYHFYEKDQNWIPPLRSEQKKLFSHQKNPTLAHSDYCLYLLLENNQTIGRIATFVDHHFNNHWKSSVGFFGSYECVEDDQASKLLLEQSYKWLAEKGMKQMRGPISFESQNWGFIVKGFGPQPIMSPYNPAYYNLQMEGFGLRKVKDLEVFAGHSGSYEMPERFLRHKEYLLRKYHLSIRKVNMRQFKEEVNFIINIANASLAKNWGFAPITNDEATVIAKDLKQIINPDVVLIIESDGRPIGFSIALPDVNILLKGLNGRLFPFGIFRFIFGLKSIQSYRHWALGIIPEFQRRGLDTLLYIHTYEALRTSNAYLEANYILEDNYAMKDAVIKLGLEKVRTLRIYEMEIANRA